MSPAKVSTLFFILPIALTIDIIGIVLVIFGLDDFFITDTVAVCVIGGWFWGLSQFTGKPTEVELPSPRRKIGPKKGGKKVAKLSKWTKRLKWLRPLLIVCEFIPYVGAFFWWTIWVVVEVKNLKT